MINYEYKVIEDINNNHIFAVEKQKDEFGIMIDSVIQRSLYLYKNKSIKINFRHCHTCSKLMMSGKTSRSCPKHHHNKF